MIKVLAGFSAGLVIGVIGLIAVVARMVLQGLDDGIFDEVD